METSVKRSTELYDRRARVATYWSNKASDLHAAAGAIWHCMQDENSKNVATALGLGRGFSMPIATLPVFRMLCGMALELAFKAVIVSLGDKPPPKHDLLNLARLARVNKLTKREAGVLGLLTEYIIWDGRYPVPKSSDFMEKQDALARKTLFRATRMTKLTVLSPIAPSPLSWEEFQKLWSKAWKEYVPARE
jgi:hypothetical protein